jgi:uncharacterized protein (TIGR02145 family)
MAENLRVTKYNDGTPIPLDTAQKTWFYATTPKFSFYNNMTSADSLKKYGAIYNGYVVSPTNPKKIAPAGWHVPTDAEWTAMLNFLIAKGYNWDGSLANDKTAKSLAARTDWYPDSTKGAVGSDLTTNNRSGFSALPGGLRYINGIYAGIGSFGYWWTSSSDGKNLYYRDIFYLFGMVGRTTALYGSGVSVRLIRD